MKKPSKYIIIYICVALFMATSCSTTSNLPEDEVLYVGMTPINYTDTVPLRFADYMEGVKEEVEAALACAPNGSVFGSSYMRNPLQIRLGIYNTFANSESGFGKWMRDHFGREPVLISNVNPPTRALVAQNLLRSYGFFNAKATGKVIPQANAKKAKVGYDITTGHLYTIDTLKHYRFNAGMDSVIRANMKDCKIHSGNPFSTAALDEERNRISNLLRENGYYYYRPAYATILADSLNIPGSVEVRMQPIAGIPSEATRKWYLGRMTIQMRRNISEQLTDTVVRRNITVIHGGKRSPMRARAIRKDMTLRRGNMFRQSDLNESSSVLNSLGLFSVSSFSFTPRDTTDQCDTLDMILNCVLDKPYDVSVEANYTLKSDNRMGPGLVLGLSKRNAFRGGEKLSLKLMGSYEWQTGRQVTASKSSINSYEYGAELSLEYPRIEAFGLLKRRRFHSPPSTVLSLSINQRDRANYYKLLTVKSSVTYKVQASRNWRHEFTPVGIDYNRLYGSSYKFDSIMLNNLEYYYSMLDMFVPKLQYSVSYQSDPWKKNPIFWEATFTEAGNIVSLGYMAFGKNFGTPYKTLFGIDYAQFIKLSSSLRKTWQLGFKSQLVGRVAGGIIIPYGNSEVAPFAESFYVGGANSIRAFTVRSVGPGRYRSDDAEYAYFDRVGDIKLEANLEYRFNIFGGLYGALFLDAGNVWNLKNFYEYEGAEDGVFRLKDFWREMALGTGFGVRYDLDFFVLRLDLGIGLHLPYDTGKSGFYNIPKFRDGLGFHFAIGYPF